MSNLVVIEDRKLLPAGTEWFIGVSQNCSVAAYQLPGAVTRNAIVNNFYLEGDDLIYEKARYNNVCAWWWEHKSGGSNGVYFSDSLAEAVSAAKEWADKRCRVANRYKFNETIVVDRCVSLTWEDWYSKSGF